MADGLVRAFVAARDLEIGDLIADNDPRMPGRKLRVISFTTSREDSRKVIAVCHSIHERNPREHRIAIKRIHSDGKRRRSGFSVLRS